MISWIFYTPSMVLDTSLLIVMAGQWLQVKRCTYVFWTCSATGLSASGLLCWLLSLLGKTLLTAPFLLQNAPLSRPSIPGLCLTNSFIENLFLMTVNVHVLAPAYRISALKQIEFQSSKDADRRISVETAPSSGKKQLLLSYVRSEAAQHALLLKEELTHLGFSVFLVCLSAGHSIPSDHSSSSWHVCFALVLFAGCAWNQAGSGLARCPEFCCEALWSVHPSCHSSLWWDSMDQQRG